VLFIDTRMAHEAFSHTAPNRTKDSQFDALVEYADGTHQYFRIRAKTKNILANELRKRGVL